MKTRRAAPVKTLGTLAPGRRMLASFEHER
jgi:hypothetical protein